MSHLDLFAIPLYRTIIGAPTESEQEHIQGVAMTEGRSTALNSTNLHILDVIQLRELRHKVESGIAEYMDHLGCLLYTSPSPRDLVISRMPSSA